MEDIILVGYGGHAKSVADCIERAEKYRIIGYTDLEKVDSNYPYLGPDEVLKEYFERGVKNVAICQGYLGHGELRQKLYEYVKNIGFSLPIIMDPTSIVSETAIVDEGTFIGKSAIINADAHIGKMCIVNTKALIEHECEVGDFSHIAGAAVICGQVRIGKAAFIGANSTVIQCQELPNGKIVPAGMTIR